MSIGRQLLHEFRPLFRLLEEPFGRSAVAPHMYPQRPLFDDPFFSSPGAIRPAVDVTEEGDNYILEADLPGVKKENVDIKIGDGGRSVIIEGKISSRQFNGELANADVEATGENASEGSKDMAKTQGTQLNVERLHSGSSIFTRTVWLPRPVDSSRVSAKLQDGILTMTVPKVEKPESVKVAVE